MKTFVITDEELDLIREAVSLHHTALEKFADEQHEYTVACNVLGDATVVKASAVLELRLREDCRHYEQLLDKIEEVTKQ